MSAIFGHLNVSDSDYVFSATVGQQVIYEAAQAWVDRASEDLNRLLTLFVSMNTTNYKERYRLPPANLYLARRGSDGRFPSMKAAGYWDVAFPMEDFGSMLTGNDISMARMTVAELDNHINAVIQANTNLVRFELLKALMYRANATFSDERWGDLTITRLANTDGTTYPPILGSVTDADDEHYAETGFAATAIDDTHDPWSGVGMTTPASFSIIDELEEHFGVGAGESEIVSFINKAEVSEVSALTDFEEIHQRQIAEGSQSATPVGAPANIPGTVIGRHRAGAWIVRWDMIPANYILSVHAGAEAPLKKRVDPAPGLGTDLQIVARDEVFPFKETTWRHIFGFGVANRLNGCVVECGVGGSYSNPTLV